jgi:hypothetical protein
MHIAIAHLVSASPYSQSKNIDESVIPKKSKERPDLYEERVWRSRMHVSRDGNVEIPQTAFGNCIREAARRLQLQIQGKGKTQYTKYIEAGIEVAAPLVLPIKAKDVPHDRLFVHSDGKRGGAKRVYRHFPRIDSWEGEITIYVLDDQIPEDVFAKVLRSAGILVGIGRFRPENRGFYGRFSVQSLKWIEDGDSALLETAAQ